MSCGYDFTSSRSLDSLIEQGVKRNRYLPESVNFRKCVQFTVFLLFGCWGIQCVRWVTALHSGKVVELTTSSVYFHIGGTFRHTILFVSSTDSLSECKFSYRSSWCSRLLPPFSLSWRLSQSADQYRWRVSTMKLFRSWMKCAANLTDYH